MQYIAASMYIIVFLIAVSHFISKAELIEDDPEEIEKFKSEFEKYSVNDKGELVKEKSEEIF